MDDLTRREKVIGTAVAVVVVAAFWLWVFSWLGGCNG